MVPPTFYRIVVSAIVAWVVTTISDELNMSSTMFFMAFYIFMLATSFGSPVIGPLSEVYGRQPIVYTSNVYFLSQNLACRFAHSKGLPITSTICSG